MIDRSKIIPNADANRTSSVPSATPIEAFLATVTKVYTSYDDLNTLNLEDDWIPTYTKNSEFYSNTITNDKRDTSLLGAIRWVSGHPGSQNFPALPFDKNNMTYPIEGETVIVLKLSQIGTPTNDWYYLPFSKTLYPNYRRDLETKRNYEPVSKGNTTSDTGNTGYKETEAVGANVSKSDEEKPLTDQYSINEKIKMLKPYTGDTIITGRSGSSIRLSNGLLTKNYAPSIVIRNKQSDEETNLPIGRLAEENINLDGSSIYMTSDDIRIPFKETTTKERKAFKEYPSDQDWIGNQTYMVSDRIVLSAKSKEFIIFGKSNTGIITDGNFTIDSKNQFLMDAENGIEVTTKNNNQLLMTEDGKIYIGIRQDIKNNIKPAPLNKPEEDIQQMVLGNRLVDVIDKLCQIIIAAKFSNSGGPATIDPGSINKIVKVQETLVKGDLLSNRVFLSK